MACSSSPSPGGGHLTPVSAGAHFASSNGSSRGRGEVRCPELPPRPSAAFERPFCLDRTRAPASGWDRVGALKRQVRLQTRNPGKPSRMTLRVVHRPSKSCANEQNAQPRGKNKHADTLAVRRHICAPSPHSFPPAHSDDTGTAVVESTSFLFIL